MAASNHTRTDCQRTLRAERWLSEGPESLKGIANRSERPHMPCGIMTELPLEVLSPRSVMESGAGWRSAAIRKHSEAVASISIPTPTNFRSNATEIWGRSLTLRASSLRCSQVCESSLQIHLERRPCAAVELPRYPLYYRTQPPHLKITGSCAFPGEARLAASTRAVRTGQAQRL